MAALNPNAPCWSPTKKINTVATNAELKYVTNDKPKDISNATSRLGFKVSDIVTCAIADTAPPKPKNVPRAIAVSSSPNLKNVPRAIAVSSGSNLKNVPSTVTVSSGSNLKNVPGAIANYAITKPKNGPEKTNTMNFEAKGVTLVTTKSAPKIITLISPKNPPCINPIDTVLNNSNLSEVLEGFGKVSVSLYIQSVNSPNSCIWLKLELKHISTYLFYTHKLEELGKCLWPIFVSQKNRLSLNICHLWLTHYNVLLNRPYVSLYDMIYGMLNGY